MSKIILNLNNVLNSKRIIKMKQKNIYFKNQIKKRHNRKSQLKIGESILVLMIFFILLVLGLIFYAKIQVHLNEEEKDKYQAKRIIDMALAVKFLPELQCSTQATEEFDCIDLAKLESFEKVVGENLLYQRYYAQLFPNAKIIINQSFSPRGEALSESGKILIDNVYELDPTKRASLTILSLPVTLYDPIMDINSFGFITLEAYS
jgi:hypothetical protein